MRKQFVNGDIVETIDDRPFHQKAKEWVIDKKDAFVDTVKLYPKEFLTGTIILGGGILKVLPKIITSKNVREQERIKKEYCYDTSLGHYWALRRPLSNKEWMEIERRKANGEKLGDILGRMKVLK